MTDDQDHETVRYTVKDEETGTYRLNIDIGTSSTAAEGFTYDASTASTVAKAEDDEPGADEKRKHARTLEHAADDIESVADDIDRGTKANPRAKALKEDADRVRETAEYMADEAETEDGG